MYINYLRHKVHQTLWLGNRFQAHHSDSQEGGDQDLFEACFRKRSLKDIRFGFVVDCQFYMFSDYGFNWSGDCINSREDICHYGTNRDSAVCALLFRSNF